MMFIFSATLGVQITRILREATVTLYTVQLPENLYHRLQKQAAIEKRPVDELVQKALTRQLPPAVPVEDDLPSLLRDELLAMAQLSDGVLWQLARSTMSNTQLAELDQLSTKPPESLSADEVERKQALLHEYDETILRRAHAAMLLQSRGFDLSNPSVLS